MHFLVTLTASSFQLTPVGLQSLSAQLIPRIAYNFDVRHWRRDTLAYRQSGDGSVYPVKLLKLLKYCLSCGFNDETSAILIKVARYFEKFQEYQEKDFTLIAFPFLRGLATMLKENTHGLEIAVCQQLFSRTLKAYSIRYVGIEPEVPEGRRSAISC